MRGWASLAPSRVQEFVIPCASSGNITVSLHNLALHPPRMPLTVCIPPFGAPPHKAHKAHKRRKTSSLSLDVGALPDCLRSRPLAVIHYRWRPVRPVAESEARSSSWPTPIHDVLFGYSWITRQLGPPSHDDEPREVYVYGSYLGASLAAALALTECHVPHPQHMPIRGLLALNGIYNWTMFLRDHPIQKEGRRRRLDVLAGDGETAGTGFHHLRQSMPVLFPTPASLFDAFASPSLLFHSPGLWVPPDFGSDRPVSPELLRMLDELHLTTDERERVLLGHAKRQKAPHKGHIKFPPEGSTLRFPDTLLLHEAPVPSARPARTTTRPTGEHNFGVQAQELCALMRRSLERVDMSVAEAEEKVRTLCVGAGAGAGAGAVHADEAIGMWLDERVNFPRIHTC